MTPALANLFVLSDRRSAKFASGKNMRAPRSSGRSLKCAYPDRGRSAFKAVKPLRQVRVIVVCPSEEYHEVGPLIVANYLPTRRIRGPQDSSAPTRPKPTFLSAVKVLKAELSCAHQRHRRSTTSSKPNRSLRESSRSNSPM
ncbi:MAG: hypothetical protein MZU97_18200 [Bacillus subtilis]|nr:hypothetical protein [Bacillus subtilis]